MRVRDLHGYPADRRVDQDEATLEVYQAARQKADVVGEVRCRDKMEGLHPAGVHEDHVVIDDTHADRSEDQRCRRACVLARKLVVQSAGRERSFQDREERLINHRNAKGAEVEVELGDFLESDELWARPAISSAMASARAGYEVARTVSTAPSRAARTSPPETS